MSDAVLASDAADAPARPPGPRLAPVQAITGAPRSVDLAGLNFTLSPRRQTIDPDHVRTLAGLFTHLPPIVVHAPSSAVIDGVHRVMAARVPRARHDQRRRLPGQRGRGGGPGRDLQRDARQAAHGARARGRGRGHPPRPPRLVGPPGGRDLRPVSQDGRHRAGRASEDLPQLRGRVGRDGRVRPVDPSAQRRRIADALAADPSASTRQIAVRTGAAQGTVRDVRTRLDDGRPVVPSAADRSESPAPRKATPLGDDAAYGTSAVSAAFVEWFDRHVVQDDDEWLSFVPAVPVGRVVRDRGHRPPVQRELAAAGGRHGSPRPAPPGRLERAGVTRGNR